MKLDASPVSDIVGGLEYEATDLELRLALSEKGYDSWAAFVGAHKTGVAPLIIKPFRARSRTATGPTWRSTGPRRTW
jgi:hypothetical protein